MAYTKIVFDPPLGGDEGIVFGKLLTGTIAAVLVTVEDLVVSLQWTEDRIRAALEGLTARGLITGNQFGWWPVIHSEVELI